MIFLPLLIEVWFLWDRHRKSASERAKFFAALTVFVLSVSSVSTFPDFPSIGLGLIVLTLGSVVIQRAFGWYRSGQL